MKTPRKQKKTTVKPARGPRHASADAAATASTFSGLLLSLESRLMFDGAAVATVSSVTTEQIAQSQADASFSADDAETADTAPAAPTGEPQPTNGDQALFDALAAYDTSVARQEIVFLSSSVREYQQLLDGISPNVEVIVLDPARDGVEQMAETLAGRTGINALHLIGEGTEAEMHLGTSFLTQESIGTRYAEQFQQIGQSLSASADLLIYGCNFGRGEAGQNAIQFLATLTGADVAASTDRTGHDSQFGDWQLEVSTGMVESSVVIGEYTQSTWVGALATFTVTTANDSGAGSLRTAITGSNAAVGTDTIVFNIAGAGAHTISLTTALPTITDTVILDATTQSGYAAGSPVIVLDGMGAGAEASGFVLQASNSTITGFRIQNFINGTTSITGTGIVIDGTAAGGDNNTISQNYLTNNSESVTGAVGAISITGAANNNLITDNQLINNNSDGIRFADALSIGVQITNNVITGSGDDGVKLIGANITFTGNIVSNSQRLSATAAGVELDTVSGTSVISNNTITNDGTRGIEGGVWIANNSTGVTVGNNTITGWSGSGIAIGGNSTGIHLTQNSITNNGLLGIDLGANGVTANDVGDGDTGANNLQNFPVLTSAQVLSSSQVTLAGSLNSTANSQFRVEFFSNTAQDGTGHGEGQTYLGFVDVTTDGSGNANFNTTLTATVSAGSFVSATATRSNATFTTFTDTSEFAQNAVAANTAPALDASLSPVLTSINEDAGAPVGAVGTLVRNLVDFAVPAGQVDNVTDVDSGALLGIAVTAADTTNGTWFYSTNNGTSWTALGAVDGVNARLLAADANTRLYFQPNADYNGTLANAITFRAWDQSSGVNGGTAATVNATLDTFSVASYSNNDGTFSWTTDWIENDSGGGGATGGNYFVSPPSLRFSQSSAGRWIYREADLSGEVSATFSFNLTQSSLTGIADIAVQVSGNGGASFTTLTNITNGTPTGMMSFDITAFAASNTQIRFFDVNGGPPTRYILVDDIQITVPGNNGGTTAFSTATDTAPLTVNAVNDAPVLDASKSPVLTSINEDTGVPVGAVGTLVRSLVDYAVPAGQVDNVTDVDSGALLGLAVTAADTTNGTWFFSTNNGASWNALGAVANANARLLAADANTRLYFQPNADYNGTLANAITFRAWDRTSGANGALADTSTNGGTTAFSTATDTAALTVNAVNDAPTATNLSAAETYTEDTALNLINIVVSDVDSANVTATLTLSNVAAGSLSTGTSGAVTSTFVGGVWTASGARANVNTLLAGVTFTPALNFNSNFTIATSVSDGVAAAITGVKNMTGIPVNDAPVVDLNAGAAGNNVTTAFTEQTPVLLAPVGTLGDVDSANMNRLRVTLTARPDGNAVESLSLDAAATAAASGAGLTVTYTSASGLLQITGAATTATYQTILQGILYNNTSDTPTTSNRTITVVARDSTNVSSTSRTATITVNPVNDAPVNTVPGAQGVNEDTALALGGISVNDVDGNLSTVQLGVTQGTVTVNLAGGATISSGANGTATLTLAGTQAQINAALATLVYQGTLNYNGPDTLTVTSTDSNAVTDVDTVALTVNPVNDAPVNTVPGAQGVNEDTALALGGISVNDVDGNLSTVQLGVTQGTVTVNLAGGATISSGANGTATLTLSGTQAQINAALGTLSYQGTLNYNGPDTLTVTSTDSNAVTDVDTVALTVNPVNDAPVNTVPGAQGVNEDTALALGGISVNDVDGNLSTVQLGVTQGTVTVNLAGGATISSGANGTATLTLSGTQAQINAALGTLSYQGTLNYNGPDTLTVTSTDSNAVTDIDTVALTVNPVDDLPVSTVDVYATTEDTGLNVPALTGVLANDTGIGDGGLTLSVVGPVIGGAVVLNNDGSFSFTPTANFNGAASFTYQVQDGDGDVSSALVTINVNPVNDAPSLATNAGSTVVQGLTDFITSGELQMTDPDNSPAQLTYTVTTVPLNGQLELTTAPGVAITSFTQVDINAGRLVFVHNGAVSTSDSFTITVSDGAGGTIGATTFNFTVTPFVPPPPPPPPPPGPGPVPVPVPVPGPTGPPPGGVVPPVLQPPPVLVTVVGATDEPARKMALLARTFARVEQPEIVPQEPSALPLELLSMPVKTMLAMGHKLDEHLTRLADDLERAMQEREHQAHLVGRVASFSGIALSVGFVAWILRGGSLLASFLVSMPAWRHFDPMPVLGSGGKDRRKRAREAREEHAQETKEFRGLDRVLKSSGKPAKQKKTGHVRRPKS